MAGRLAADPGGWPGKGCLLQPSTRQAIVPDTGEPPPQRANGRASERCHQRRQRPESTGSGAHPRAPNRVLLPEEARKAEKSLRNENPAENLMGGWGGGGASHRETQAGSGSTNPNTPNSKDPVQRSGGQQSGLRNEPGHGGALWQRVQETGPRTPGLRGAQYGQRTGPAQLEQREASCERGSGPCRPPPRGLKPEPRQPPACSSPWTELGLKTGSEALCAPENWKNGPQTVRRTRRRQDRKPQLTLDGKAPACPG